MKTQSQNSPELTHLCKMIEHIPTATLTILDASGTPLRQSLVPLQLDGQGALWFFGNLHSANIEQPCDANLSFVDTVKPTYVALSGLAEIHVNQVRLERLWTPFSRPWFPDGPESAKPALLKLAPQLLELGPVRNGDRPHSIQSPRSRCQSSIDCAGYPSKRWSEDPRSGWTHEAFEPSIM